MDEQGLQTLVDYYRNKCSQLELDFIQFQITSASTINDLNQQLANALEAAEAAGTKPSKRANAAEPVAEDQG